MVFTGRASGVGGAAAPTSCQNMDPDSECWVCPSGWLGMLPAPPAKAWPPWGTGVLRPWSCSSPAGCACLLRGHTCHQASMQCPAWTLGSAQQPFHLSFPARQTSPFVTTFSLGTKM